MGVGAWCRVVVAGAVVVGSVVLAAPAAHACSCALLAPEWFPANTDVGFVGTVTAVEPVGEDGSAEELTFDVELWLNGDFGEAEVTVRTGLDCSAGLRVGQRRAVFARADGAVLRGGDLCSTFDADHVLAAVGALEFPGGLAHLLVPVTSPRGSLAVVDRDGVVLGYRGPGVAQGPRQVGRCPGGRRAVVVYGRHADVVDLTTLEVERIDLGVGEDGVGIAGVRCDDEQAASVRLVVGQFPNAAFAVWQLRSLEVLTELAGEQGPPVLVADGVLAFEASGPVVLGDDGSRRPIPDVVDPWRSERIVVSPDGDRILVNRLGDPVELSVIDVATGEIVASSPVGPARVLMPWVESGRVVNSGGDPPDLSPPGLEIRDAATLEVVATVGPFRPGTAVLDGDLVWGGEEGSLVRADLDSGRAMFLDTTPAIPFGEPLVLPAPIELAPERMNALLVPRPPTAVESTATTSPSETSTTTTTSPSETPRADGSGRPIGTITTLAAGIAGVALIGVFVARRRRLD